MLQALDPNIPSATLLTHTLPGRDSCSFLYLVICLVMTSSLLQIGTRASQAARPLKPAPRAVALKVWSLDEMHQPHRGAGSKCKFLAPPQAYRIRNSGVGPSTPVQQALQVIRMDDKIRGS